jgi:two-component system chemotaxis response regulator CheY
MPKMTGLELLKILQNDEELKNIPFIIVTSDSNKEKINESKKEGVNEYIIKPFNAAELKKRIKSVLK